MARSIAQDIFRAFRFALYLPKGQRLAGCSSIYTDPFSGNVWIERAHQGTELTLRELFTDEEEVEVWLFQALHGSGRRITMRWTDTRWMPLDLDASASRPAMERLALLQPSYALPLEFACDDLPAYIRPVVLARESA